MQGIIRPKPLTRKKLSDMVEEELETMIRRGDIPEGGSLPSERDLMALFNVGRPSIRGALSSLARKGLVKISSGEKARVIRPSADTIIGELSGMARDFLSQPDGIKNFEQLRQFFEAGLVRYAAIHATEEDIAQLEQILEENRQSINDDDLFVRTDIEFHQTLAKIPNNPVFLSVHKALLNWLIEARAPTSNPAELHRKSYEHHVSILNALKAKDPQQAEKALSEHLDNVLSTYYKQ